MSTNDQPVSGRQKAALWVAVIGGPILAETYWKYQGYLDWLDGVPPIAAAFVSGAICAVAGWLYGSTPAKRTAGVVSGALIGFGVNWSFQLMHGDSLRVSSGERWLAFALGAVPGLVLAIAWMVILDKRAKAPPA